MVQKNTIEQNKLKLEKALESGVSREIFNINIFLIKKIAHKNDYNKLDILSFAIIYFKEIGIEIPKADIEEAIALQLYFPKTEGIGAFVTSFRRYLEKETSENTDIYNNFVKISPKNSCDETEHDNMLEQLAVAPFVDPTANLDYFKLIIYGDLSQIILARLLANVNTTIEVIQENLDMFDFLYDRKIENTVIEFRDEFFATTKRKQMDKLKEVLQNA